MAKVFPVISPLLQEWLLAQKLFFVGSAPLSSDGHVNISPKGMDCFRIISPTEVAYLDLTGSGIETIAQIKENKRIVLMFCAFEGAPRIVRIHGQGKVYEVGTPEFEEYVPHFRELKGMRSIIYIHATRVSTSCGYGVPLFSYQGERDMLDSWADNKGPEGIVEYKLNKNATSIDGLPGLDSVQKEEKV